MASLKVDHNLPRINLYTAPSYLCYQPKCAPVLSPCALVLLLL